MTMTNDIEAADFFMSRQDDLVKRAREALDGVTPGPWEVPDQTYTRNLTVNTGGGMDAIMLACPGTGGAMSYTDEVCTLSWSGGEHDANARFIAAARDLVPAMADRIEALEAAMARADELMVALLPIETLTAEMFARNWNRDGVAVSFITPSGPIRLTFGDLLKINDAIRAARKACSDG